MKGWHDLYNKHLDNMRRIWQNRHKRSFDGMVRSPNFSYFPNHHQLPRATPGSLLVQHFPWKIHKRLPDEDEKMASSILCPPYSLEYLFSGGKLCRGMKQRIYNLNKPTYPDFLPNPPRLISVAKKHFKTESSDANAETSGNLY